MDDLREKYVSNSLRSKSEAPVEPKPELHQISAKPARIQKKSPGRKFLESFIAEDVVSIKDYILYDVLLPAIKNTVVDAVTNSIQMILWGDTKRSSNTQRFGGKTYVSYGNYSSMSSSSNCRSMDNTSRSRHDFGNIVLDSRGEAEEVLSQLVDLTVDYGFASVSDLYCLVGIQSTPIDQKWGWYDLSQSSVSRISDGYILKLPKTTTLK